MIVIMSFLKQWCYQTIKEREREREDKNMSRLRSCVNREVGLGSHSLSHSSPVHNKPKARS